MTLTQSSAARRVGWNELLAILFFGWFMNSIGHNVRFAFHAGKLCLISIGENSVELDRGFAGWAIRVPFIIPIDSIFYF